MAKSYEYAGTAALIGNPNVGKSTVFNALTGLHQHTGNWPGKTVDTASGFFRAGRSRYRLVDLPGTYSLLPHSQEEAVARDYIRSGKADVIIAVCDATCLERNLILVLQLLELTDRVIVCLNLMDEAERNGIIIDAKALSALLNVPVVCVTARKKRTLSPLLDAVEETVSRPKSDFAGDVPSSTGEDRSLLQASAAHSIALKTVSRLSPGRNERTLKADLILTHRVFGFLIMLCLLVFLLWLTIKGANYPSRLLSEWLFGIGDSISRLFISLGAPEWLRSALIDGVYRVLAWVISVMLPPMAIFFPLFTLLEDAGYLPRIAFNLDKPFQRCQACGKQALTMAMGFGCNAVGVTGCRIIDSPREKLLAILTNSFVPCNGRFPIMITLTGIFFAAGSALSKAVLLSCFLLLGIGATFLATRLLSATVLKGTPSSFTLELPPYRRPQPGRILLRSVFDRTLFVMGRAAAVAAPAGLVIWLMANCTSGGRSLLYICAEALEPAGRLLGMDGVILLAFILGWPANETVIPIMLMIYLSRGTLSAAPSDIGQILAAYGWTPVKALCVLVFTVMHWPCSTTLLTIRKETGSIKWTLMAALLPTAFGAAVCTVIHLAARLLGIG